MEKTCPLLLSVFFLLFVYLSVHLFIFLFLVSCISLDLIYRRKCSVALIFFCIVVTFKSQAVKFNVML